MVKETLRVAFTNNSRFSRYSIILHFSCILTLSFVFIHASKGLRVSASLTHLLIYISRDPLSQTSAFRSHYTQPTTNISIDNDLAMLREILHLAKSTIEDPPSKVEVSTCITNDPLNAQYEGYTLTKDPIDSFCPTSLGRIPKGHEAMPPCLSVIRNAFIGSSGVVFQPSTGTIFELGGGCCADMDWTNYYKQEITFSASELSNVKPGRVVMNFGQHHGSTFHHVMYELLPRYLSVAPLVEQSGMEVLIDNYGISSSLLIETFAVPPKQILTWPFRDVDWLYASVILIPPPVYQEMGRKYYPSTVERATSLVIRDTILANSSVKSDGKKTLVLLERAKTRKSNGDCSEIRCIKNFQALHDGILEKFGENYTVVKFGAAETLTRAVNLFAIADVIVGFHGAGFQNMMFCREGITVVHIGWGLHYKKLAVKLGMRYHLSLAENTSRNSRNITLDVGKVLSDIEVSLQEDIEFEKEQS